MIRHPLSFNSELVICDQRSGWSDLDALSFLDDTEYHRLGSFNSSDAAQQFLAARYFLKRILGDALSLPPSSLSFAYTDSGKPFLSQSPDIQFNISHAQDLIAVVLSFGYEVGVDIEFQRPVTSVEALSARFFSPTEQTFLKNLPSECRSDAFFYLWTRKEAFLKTLGGGLSMGLHLFDVDGSPVPEPEFRRLLLGSTLPGVTADEYELECITDRLPSGYFGAVGVRLLSLSMDSRTNPLII